MDHAVFGGVLYTIQQSYLNALRNMAAGRRPEHNLVNVYTAVSNAVKAQVDNAYRKERTSSLLGYRALPEITFIQDPAYPLGEPTWFQRAALAALKPVYGPLRLFRS